MKESLCHSRIKLAMDKLSCVLMMLQLPESLHCGKRIGQHPLWSSLFRSSSNPSTVNDTTVLCNCWWMGMYALQEVSWRNSLSIPEGCFPWHLHTHSFTNFYLGSHKVNTNVPLLIPLALTVPSIVGFGHMVTWLPLSSEYTSRMLWTCHGYCQLTGAIVGMHC